MIFTDYSQHIPKITASPVCTAIKNDIKLCLSFSQGLKIHVVYFQNAPASRDSVPRPPAGRDVRNRFLNFGSVSVRFLKNTRIRFGMNLILFGLQKLGSVRIVI